MSSSFRKLREEKVLFDVTLAVEKSKFQAHKVILSACSKFFKEILEDNVHPHPFVYLKGVETRELQSILDFVYEGEARIEKQRLDTFLQCAQDLQIMGLVNNQEAVDPVLPSGDGGSRTIQRPPTSRKKRKLAAQPSVVEEAAKPTMRRKAIISSPQALTDMPVLQLEEQDDYSGDPDEDVSMEGVFICPEMYEIPERLKSQSNRSWVWNYMGFLDGEVSRVTCKLCQKSLAYHNSTSSMAAHLRRYHLEETSLPQVENVVGDYHHVLVDDPAEEEGGGGHAEITQLDGEEGDEKM